MKSGDHPIKGKSSEAGRRKPSGRVALALAAVQPRPSKPGKAAVFKRGRPQRQDNPQKITINLGMEIKHKAFDLAVARRCSISRLVEDLIAACKE